MGCGITVGIASIYPRQDSLEKVLASISPQVDKVYVSLNDYPQKPPYASRFDNVEYILNDNSRGDANKFLMADKTNGFYVTWDDDIIASKSTIAYLVQGCKKHKAITTLHGKVYDRAQLPVKSYRRNIKINVRCLNSWDNDIEVDVGGTGCMAWDTNLFRISMSDLPYKNMADIQVSLLAHQQGIKIVALAHPQGYLKYERPTDATIWQTTTNDSVQTEMLNKILVK